jgi:soluble lytic murein transglycosylase-like protein
MNSRILIVAVLLAFPAGAEIAVFNDGRAIKVSSYEVSGERVVLALATGGTMDVPLLRIDRIVDDELVPEPEVVAELPGLFPRRTWKFDPRAGAKGPDDILAIVFDAAKTHDVDPSLVAAVIRAESNFDPVAVSRKGARGLMQLMPGTAARFGVTNSFDPTQNIHGGTRYLRVLLDRYDGDPELTLAAYNAGEGSVAKYDGVPPFRETVEYIRRIARFLAPDSSGSGNATGAP